MTRALRALRRRVSGDRGITLPELLVTMMLMGIVAALVAGLVTSFARTLSRESSRNDSTNVASSGMDEVSRIVRAGTPIQILASGGGTTGSTPIFTFAGREHLTLYSGVDTTSAAPKPLLVDFQLDSSRVLTETRTTARANPSAGQAWLFSGAGVTSRSRSIARTIVPATTADTYLFRYFDQAGNELVPVGTGSLSLDDRVKIARVSIYLSVQADATGRADPVTIRNAVGIPNAGLVQIGVP